MSIMNTRKLKSSISQIRRSKSIIRLFDTHAKPSSAHKYQKGKNRVHNVDAIADEKSLIIEKGQQSDGKKGKIKPVPKGYLAVYVGEEAQKFVIPAKYLSMPDLKALMDDLADEYGYNNGGALKIPCEEHKFEEVLRTCNNNVSMQKSKTKRT